MLKSDWSEQLLYFSYNTCKSSYKPAWNTKVTSKQLQASVGRGLGNGHAYFKFLYPRVS